MKSSELAKLGVPSGEAMRLAGEAIQQVMQRGVKKKNVAKTVRGVVASPEAHLQHSDFGPLAEFLIRQKEDEPEYEAHAPVPYQVWGQDIDPNAIQQMDNAARLPVAVRGAIMPDAHVGYGLPIGGVLATRKAVIPYAVGVDIACRMKLTVLDLSADVLKAEPNRLSKVLQEETHFGKKAFKKRREHDVLDEDWSVTPLVQSLKDKAWSQLGTSGGGNHFVEFGELTIGEAYTNEAGHPTNEPNDLGLPPGIYLALLSHSGSRGAGATIATHYSKLAAEIQAHLPKQLRALAWLDLDSQEGQEYWSAMELMGRYATANHACIHRHVARALGAKALATIENHHNFAWLEEDHGEQVVVHRKGATPAGEGVLGVIPGSMASPAYVVRGKGSVESLSSASHGAGRRFSRRQAKESFTWSQVRKFLTERDVTLLSAGLDEVPMAYKDIEEVMAAQTDLVDIQARFDPKLVRMNDE
ncbi:MAG: RtcB family protein [Chloroflexota bacterium]